MTKQEFGVETQRWYAGAGRSDDLTPERLAVLWDTFGHLPVLVWRNAVSAALLEPRWPDPQRMHALVGRCEDDNSRAVARQRDAEAKRAMFGGTGVLGIVSGLRAQPGFAKMCQRVTQAVLTQGLSPAQTADLLTLDLDERLCAHGVDCAEWLAALRDAGDDWRKYPVGAKVLRADVAPLTFGGT